MPSVDSVIDRKRHPDGVHRNQHGHALYRVPGEPGKALCNLCRARVDGWPYQRTTTFIDVLEARFQLENWKLRQVVKGLVLKEHLQVKAAGVFDSDKALDEIAEAAMEAADSAQGRDMGTGVHGTTEQIDRGDTDVVIHPSIKATVAAYQQLMAAHRLLVEDIECHVVIDGISSTKTTRGISGTFDRIVVVTNSCPRCNTNRRVLDLKTSKPTSFRYEFRKDPMQLATYAAGKRYDPATGERSDLNVCQCVGLVVHLPTVEDRDYDAALYTADLVAGRNGLNVAYQVWQWRQTDGLMRRVPDPQVEVETSTDPGSSGAASAGVAAPGEPDIHGLIALAGNADAVRELWRQFNSDGWTYGHDLAAKRRLAELEVSK